MNNKNNLHFWALTTCIHIQNPDSPKRTLFGVGWIRMISRRVEELPRFFPFATSIDDICGAPQL
jgi:hypothetical protein